MLGSWHGTGHPVVLLHGQPGRGRDWDPVLAVLAGLRVVAPDRPGYDGTPAQDFSGNARAVAAFATASGVDRLVVVGHSWGGGVALQLALDHPELVAGLCLVGSIGSPRAVQWSDKVWALAGMRRLAGLTVCCSAVLAPGSFERATGSRLTPSQRQTIRANGLRWLREGAASSYAAEQAHLVRDSPALSMRMHAIQAPTLVLTGSTDRTVSPWAAADLAARLPRSRLLTVPGGHLLPVEAPRLVAQAIQECVVTAAWA